MSSEEQEVEELVKAINSHAEVLYESWKSNGTAGKSGSSVHVDFTGHPKVEPAGATAAAGSSVYQRPLYDLNALKRMEDTLKMLADPNLTPKLEHYVSNFVRRDKAKRQISQGSPCSSPTNVPSSDMRRSSSPVKIIPIQKEFNGTGDIGHNNTNAKKALPKSILAALQRFEPSPSSSSDREHSPLSSKSGGRSGSPAAAAARVIMPGIGSVSRDMLNSESNISNRVSERNYKLRSPVNLTDVDGNNGKIDDHFLNNSDNYSYETQIHKSSSNSSIHNYNNNGNGNNAVREIHIPIQRLDENGRPAKIINGNVSSAENIVTTSTSRSRSRTSPSRHNTHQFNGCPEDLEREEEKLVQTLRTGQMYSPPKVSTFSKPHFGASTTTEHSNRGRSPSPLQQPQHFRYHRIDREGHSPSPNPLGSDHEGTSPNSSIISNCNSNSHIAFAKERIRHSQQHPLTQQRLELQKQFPSPSSNLAAAIAVQQGKIKFEPRSNRQTPHFPPHDDHHRGSSGPGHYHHQNSKEAGNGRQNWVSNVLRAGPSGSSSVAERVQLFEKYPSYVPMSNHGGSQQQHSPPFRPSSPRRPKSPAEPQVTHSEVYYSSPLEIPITQHKPKEITHTIRTSPELINTSSSLDSKMPSSPKLHPVKAEVKIVNHNVTKAQGDHHAPVVAMDNTFAPWRHLSSAANLHHQEIQPSVIENTIENIKPDAFSSPKKYKFGAVSPSTERIQSSGRSPLASDKTNIIGDGRQQQSSVSVPRFYWAEGKSLPSSYVQDMILKAQQEYNKLKGTVPQISEAEFGQYITSLGIPLYWKKPFWIAIGPMEGNTLDVERFLKFYSRLISECSDDASRFLRILWTQTRMSTNSINNNIEASLHGINKSSRARPFNYADFDLPQGIDVGMNDFIPMIQDIVDSHPGLGFLRDAPEFHSRYVTTVISRIFYNVNRSWSSRITLAELRRSNLLRVIKRLEEETDVNNITEYFSYEHFYVIYCKFWELDKDHDLLIDKNDLASHSDHALSSRIIDRIFSGAVIRGWDMTSPVKCGPGRMTYSDFVWFLISEEDKKTPTAIEYWFRCLNIDGDGILTPYELQYFYTEQEKRIECLGIEPLDFSNIYCQIVDMLRCSTTGIRLKDLKRNPQLASNIFNTLFNLDKYLDHEQRDPFSAASGSLADSMGGNSEGLSTAESDWDKYAAAEYDMLIADESPADVTHDTVSDFEESPTIVA